MVNYYVSPTGSDANNGLTPLTPKATIPAAHTDASNGDTIILMNGTHTYTSDITITKNVSLTSQNGAGVTTLQFTVAEKSIIFAGSSNISITNITFIDANTSNRPCVALEFSTSYDGPSKPSVWPTNVKIYGNIFNIGKYGIQLVGENIEIYNNIFNRSTGTNSISIFLTYFLRGYLLIDGNSWADETNPSRFVYIAGRGTATAPYFGFAQSKDVTATITHNTFDLSLNTASTRVTNLFIQDTWNNVGGSEAIDGLTNVDVSGYRINLYVSNNTMNLRGTGVPPHRGRGLVAFATANDTAGNHIMNQWGDVYVQDNTLNCTSPCVGDQGLVLLDTAGLTVPTAELNTLKFRFLNNVITYPSPFVARIGSAGDINFCQVTTTLPASLNTAPWISTSAPPPSYDITTYNLFLLPTDIPITLSGTYEIAYSSVAGAVNGGTSITIPLTNAAASQITVSNLPANAFKVIVGMSPTVTSNSAWFYIRIYDDTGAQITTFIPPITIDIASTNFTGAPLTVELNGTTLITTAPEVSPGVYQFQLSSNSEYRFMGPEPVTNTFPLLVSPSLLAPGTILIYTTEAIRALVQGNSLPPTSRVPWAPDGVIAGTLFKNLGRKEIVLGNNSLATHTFIQVQLINGPTTEGVDGAAPDYLCGWVCSWAASGVAPIFA